MIRKIIHIDEDKCNGCGICATACHEGAIDIIDGKAKLVRENFCDGFGDCLPGCPTGAITFEEREAPEYDDAAVKQLQEENKEEAGRMTVEEIMKIEDENERRRLMTAKMAEEGGHHHGGGAHPGGGCPGSRAMTFTHEKEAEYRAAHTGTIKPVSRLAQWPCQIKLMPPQAPFYDGAKLLIAADCSAYAYAGMHEEFMRGKVTIIGCPKLDDIDYSEKLTQIIAENDIKEVTIVRMEVPCCGGIEAAAKKALQDSGKFIPWRVVVLSRDGKILE